MSAGVVGTSRSRSSARVSVFIESVKQIPKAVSYKVAVDLFSVDIESCARSTVHRHREAADNSPLHIGFIEELAEGPENSLEIHGNSILHLDRTYQRPFRRCGRVD
jgi:hypothetical protein